MQRRLAEELGALQVNTKADVFRPGGAGYSTSIQRVVAVSVAATGASSLDLVFPSCGGSSSSSTSTSVSSPESAVSPGSSSELLDMEAFRRELSEIASQMVSAGYTEGLITEFSRHQSSSAGDAVLRTWFSELGVDWVLGVDEGSLRGETWSAVEDKVKLWAAAFTVMAEALRLTRPTMGGDQADDPSSVRRGVPSTDKSCFSRSAPTGAAAARSCWSLFHAAASPTGSSTDLDDDQSSDSEAHTSSVDVAAVKEAIRAYSAAETRRYLGFDLEEPGPQNQFLTFARASLTKMLRFPHAVVAAQRKSPEKILRMIHMYSLVSDATPGLLALLSGVSRELVSCRIESVLQTTSAAVREILQDLTRLIREEDSWRRTTTPAGNGDIHPINQYTVNYINLLLENCTVLDSMLRRRPVPGVSSETTPSTLFPSSEEEALFDMEIISGEDEPSLTAIVVELVNLLDAMLEEESRVYDDDAPGRRHIFLLNNAYFILQQADPALRKYLGTWSIVYRERQIERYIERYLDASWGPVTACLAATKHKQRRNSLFRKVSVLVDFKSSLERTCDTQRLWKVDSPQLRSTLRRSVSNKVVSAYRAYLEKHAAVQTSNMYTTEDLEALFQDLFEG